MNTSAALEPTAFPKNERLSPQELEQAHLFLQQTQNGVIGATKGLADAQWRFKPSQDRWSISENLDHIVIVQERVLGPIMDQLASAPAPPDSVDCQVVDAIVIHQFPTRLAKFSAPQFVHPLDDISPGKLLEKLARNCASLNERLDSTTGLREHAIEALPLKAVSKGTFTLMDGYQWILAAAAHTERHTKQILEVMADPEYPA